jgi:hypothetical protein
MGGIKYLIYLAPLPGIHIELSALIQTEKFARHSKECGAMIGSAFDQGRVPSLQGLVPHAIDTPRQPHI